LLLREENGKEYRVETYEKRQNSRFRARNDAYVIFPTATVPSYGFILNIGIGGVCFEYIPIDDTAVDSRVLDIVLDDSVRRFNNLPFKIIFDIEVADPCYSPVTMRRRGVEFVNLTAQQQSDLEDFIYQNVVEPEQLPQ